MCSLWRCKEIKLEGRGPRYLKKENIDDLSKGDEVRAMMKLWMKGVEIWNRYNEQILIGREGMAMCILWSRLGLHGTLYNSVKKQKTDSQS